MTTIDDFLLTKDAEEGVKMPLFDKYGNETEHYIIVRHADCPQAEKVRRSYQLRLAKLDKNKVDARIKLHEDMRNDLFVALIAGWSLDSIEFDFTPENVIKLMNENRPLADKIDVLAGDHALFFAKRQESSLSGQDQN